MSDNRKKPGRVWRRLRVVQVAEPTDAETLQRLVDQLEGGEVSSEVRRSAAGYLRSVLASPAARAALRPRWERRTPAPDLALAYLVHKELLGKGLAARQAVADAWNVSPETVKDAFTDFRANAVVRLRELIDHRVGTLELASRQSDGTYTETLWTRERLLDAVLGDLLDHRNATRSRKKSR